MEIEYVNHGIGNNFGDVIELNKNLLKYPKLHKAILDHELKHNNGSFKKNFVVDISETKVGTVELLNFMIRNPRSFSQFLPFYWTKKWGFVYDVNLIITYLIALVCIGTTIFLTAKYL